MVRAMHERLSLRRLEETIMPNGLEGKRFAMLATDGFEQSELFEPYEAIRRAGGQVDIVSLRPGFIQGVRHHEKGETIEVDDTIDHVKADAYAGLVLPGGVANPDALRLNPAVVAFIRDFFAAKKPVAAICHAPWTLIEAGVVRGRTVTSWPSLRTDLTNAGARWVDREVVVDDGLITSRSPADLPAFCQKAIAAFHDA
jgi:protease I